MRKFMILLFGLMMAGSEVLAQGPPAFGEAEQALMESAFKGDLESVRRLVASGTEVDAVNAEKSTALMWASFNGHTPVVSFLLESGAKINALDGNGRPALQYASSGPYVETVKLLLDMGAEVNVQGTLEGFTALMTAAAEGQLEVVRLLLERGADPRLLDKDGDTAESFARQKGHAAVETLLKDLPAPAPPGE
jgi:ankyrin repeat protein